MDTQTLASLQFAATTTFHFIFVPLTLGLSLMLAIMETAYVRTGEDIYYRMTKFWGKLFLINFALGVGTGIVLEFQFGMNWSEYSRFMGDIFGAPLAIEALLAFFLESTFLGVWVFGWNRLPKWAHAASMWMVALGSNLSALWILTANSFMHEPVGYTIEDGRAVMTDFVALLTNPHVWVQFPHTLAAGMSTGAFFILGVSAWHLRRALRGETPPDNPHRELFHRSFRWGAVYAVVAVVLVIFVGHSQAQHMIEAQPMKMAAAEGLFYTEENASLSLLTIGDFEQREEVFSIRIPGLLSFLAYNRFDGTVQGLHDLNAQYQEQYADQYGPDADYIPPVAASYWSFRAMIGAGFLMLFLAGMALWYVYRNTYAQRGWLLRLLPFMILMPYFANTAGWWLTEVGRQPWIVFGLQRTVDGVSPNVSTASLVFSLVAFTALYGTLITADVFLLRRFARAPERTLAHADDHAADATPRPATS